MRVVDDDKIYFGRRFFKTSMMKTVARHFFIILLLVLEMFCLRIVLLVSTLNLTGLSSRDEPTDLPSSCITPIGRQSLVAPPRGTSVNHAHELTSPLFIDVEK
jgi:hypothetical protein